MLLLLEINVLHLILPVALLLAGWPPPLPRTHPFHRGEGGWCYDHDHGRGGGGGTRNLEHIYISKYLHLLDPKKSNQETAFVPQTILLSLILVGANLLQQNRCKSVHHLPCQWCWYRSDFAKSFWTFLVFCKCCRCSVVFLVRGSDVAGTLQYHI